jgi:rod shape determining protein RodA
MRPASNGVDWILFFAVIPLLAFGLITMKSFGLPDQGGSGASYFFARQLIWISIGFLVFFSFSFVDWRFLRKGEVLAALFVLSSLLLGALFVFGSQIKGASSWFSLGVFSVEPADPIKIILIGVLAKYFSRRHIEIANIKHIIISGFYALIPFFLIILQPDFGSAIIIFFIWLGMILVSGISKKHLALVFLVAVLSILVLWMFVFAPYQKERIISFLNPLSDIRGAGYNAYQSVIAVGSGRLFGKGIGYGTQSRLAFLPEHETDFIFAAFAEEWGFAGVLLLFLFFSILIWRILKNATIGATNFESFFGVGVAIFLMSHFTINVGMNIGLLPITGTTIPFLSYGGSHMITVFAALGILMGMRRYSYGAHREDVNKEFLGL